MIKTSLTLFFVMVLAFLAGCSEEQTAAVAQVQGEPEEILQEVDAGGRWQVHDMERPAPPVVNPGEPCFKAAPEDATVLFDGKDLSQWVSDQGGPAHWQVQDGCMEVRKGGIKTRQAFGSCQLHLEFATPAKVEGSSQGRGNSGVFLQGCYEVQVLDSYDNPTYPDGQCAALYGRAVPLVNASRGPGQWQSYDIVFHRPLFEGSEVVRKATFTVIHNGVLVQDHVALDGGTGWMGPHAVTPYEPHGDTGPIALQDHNNPMRFRNIWIRPLDD